MIFDRLLFHKHLEREEKVVFSVHKHWIEILKPTLEVTFFGLLLPWGLYFMGFNTTLFFSIAALLTVLAYLRYFYILLDWYSDTWLITNTHVIEICWKGFFHNKARRVEYNDFEGLSYEVKGFWATVLGYGDLTLNVLSGNNLVLSNTHRPKKMELAIIHYQSRVLEEKSLRDSKGIQEILSSMVAQHMRKKLK